MYYNVPSYSHAKYYMINSVKSSYNKKFYKKNVFTMNKYILDLAKKEWPVNNINLIPFHFFEHYLGKAIKKLKKDTMNASIVTRQLLELELEELKRKLEELDKIENK